VDLISIPQIPQNSSVPDSGLPHDQQTFIAAGCGGCRGKNVSIFGKGVCELGFAILSELAPHMPHNFPVSKSGEPHMVHTRDRADVRISCLCGTVISCSPWGDPQIPQYFSSGFIGLPHDLQTSGMTSSGGTCGGNFDCRDRGNGDVLPATGNGSRTESVKGVAAGVIGSWVSSYWDAPQFLQNFADGGTTSFPHS
jgi:hypothetical protein